ncbi:hypothetical protein DES49_2662 [Halospina denitrificans]|uniref:Uncharacterized protein n=1 Tax=Halospina denitrificans TaxID=332522 RepID=A0A4R7JJ19_9GAMM|nr:hypothetical protein [Halospina denitrificans]TDT37705.1 hypothetical protein DES49_2662 [Halospina denitrificans]
MKNLGSIGLSPKDETVLKAIVDLLGPRTHETWAYTTADKADAILVDGDNVDAVAHWESHYSESGPCTIIYTSGETSLPARRHLMKPLRAADLIAHLNTVEDAPEPQTSATRDTDTAPAAGAAAQSLPQTIFDTSNGYLTISIGDYSLTLNRDHHTCVTSHTIGQMVEVLVPRDAEIMVAHSLEEPEGLNPDQVWHSDRNMLCWLGVRGSHGQLLRHLEKGGRLKLNRWPPPSLMKENPAFLNLSALFSGHSGTSVQEADERLNLSERDIVGFVNATALSGLLTQVGGAPSASSQAGKEPKGPATKGILSKLRSRLRI